MRAAIEAIHRDVPRIRAAADAHPPGTHAALIVDLVDEGEMVLVTGFKTLAINVLLRREPLAKAKDIMQLAVAAYQGEEWAELCLPVLNCIEYIECEDRGEFAQECAQ